MKPFAKRGLYEDFQRAASKLKSKKILLGLSGGKDSVALLHLLLVSGQKIVAAHLNHCLRGSESKADKTFVQRLCKKWNVPLLLGETKVPALARRHKISIEAAARIARYQFLQAIAQKQKIRDVWVAHHQNDQAETVLLKILQGYAFEKGMGMKPTSPFPVLQWRHTAKRKPSRLRLVRPLLNIPRTEIEKYVKQNKLPFREDSSNRDLKYTRNWIRHQLLPLLERRLNRNLIKTLARLG